MDDAAICAAIADGKPAAQVARAARLPLTVVYRIARGAGDPRYARALFARACSLCGAEVQTRGGTHSFCDKCAPAHFAAQCKATTTVRKAVNFKTLPPAKNCLCVDCGASAKHYDHRDYSRPLDVVPVCQSCNIRRGAARRAA